MNKYKRCTDFYFTEDGDIVLDANTGDFEDTAMHQYRGFIQRLNTRIKSQKGEWNLQRDLGAGLTDFRGKPNTAAIGQRIQSRITSELIREGLVSPDHLEVVVFPTGKHELSIMLRITPPGTQTKLQLIFSYNMNENRIVERNL